VQEKTSPPADSATASVSSPAVWSFGSLPLSFGQLRTARAAAGDQKAEAPPTSSGKAPRPGLLVENYGRLPMYFIKNQGQVDQQVQYYVHGRGQTTFFTREEIVVAWHRGQVQTPDASPGQRLPLDEVSPGKQPPSRPAVVTMQPLGLNKDLRLAALEPQEYKINYFKGNDPQKWRTDIPTFKAVAYQEAYPGIDLKFYSVGQQMEYDVVVKPGADPSQVRFAYKGIEKMEVTPEGDLALKLPDGEVLVQRKPLVYQEIAGLRVAREGKFLLQPGTANLVFGFEVASYDRAHSLVIDPVLDYSTYLGGGGYDAGTAIAVDQYGQAVVTGYTYSIDFPEKNPAFVKSDGADVFVTKFNSDGSGLVFSTFLGGEYDDFGRAIAVDEAGGIYLTGQTFSAYFPTTLGAHQRERKGGSDAFVAKLNAAGNNLAISSYLGGTKADRGRGIAVDKDHNIYVTGNTESYEEFPLKNAIFPTYRGGSQDAFVAKLSAGFGTLLFSTYLGGTKSDDGAAIAVTPGGRIYVTGNTDSSDFPVPNGRYTDFKVSPDAFLACIKANLSDLAFATFLPGNKAEYGNSVALDTTGHVYVGGYTTSTDFPTPVPRTSADAFLIKFNPDGSGPVYSTHVGGSGNDHCYAIAVDRADEVTMTGETNSTDFPTKNPLPGGDKIKGTADAFVTKFQANGQGHIYSTYLGGNNYDCGIGLAVDKGGRAYVTGQTSSLNFPVSKDAYIKAYKGGYDAFVAKIKQPPATVLLDLLLGD
jgi:hypothetical protein